MLRIKQDVDLKELEKFGFKYEKKFGCYEKVIKSVKTFGCKYIVQIRINKYSRHIDFSVDAENPIITDIPLDLIFDLIQAGLVEKVEE